VTSKSAGSKDPLFRTVDLAIGESAEVELSNGKKARVKRLDLNETRDDVCAAVRRARVKVDVNGQYARWR